MPVATLAGVVKPSTPSTATARMSDVNSSGIMSILHPDRMTASPAIATVSRLISLLHMHARSLRAERTKSHQFALARVAAVLRCIAIVQSGIHPEPMGVAGGGSHRRRFYFPQGRPALPAGPRHHPVGSRATHGIKGHNINLILCPLIRTDKEPAPTAAMPNLYPETTNCITLTFFWPRHILSVPPMNG